MTLYDGEINEQRKDKREFQETGSVKWATYKKYFDAARNRLLVVFVFLAFVDAEASVNGLNYFLSEW